MYDKIKSKTGRVFIEKGGYRVFCRDAGKNIDDIAHCAALAFHKALIGISELSLVERAGSSFRFAKALQTYYPVYHLFTCNMLLDNSYELRFKENPLFPDDYKEYEVDIEKLNNPSETPEQWDHGREYEQDLASLIQHSDIRKYCRLSRKAFDKLKPYTKILYKAFIENDGNEKHPCIPGLYEKLDYVRDRSIYRPTHVVLSDGTYAQTSYDVRKEIESLPSSEDIYNTIFSFYREVYSTSEQYEIEKLFIIYVKSDFVECKGKIAKRLGYSWEAIEKMGGKKENNTVPSFLCQMMELFDEGESLGQHRITGKN